jgi:hypothetical protein
VGADRYPHMQLPKSTEIISFTILASMRSWPECIPSTIIPLGMSTRAILLDAAVQVVNVELGGPLRPCQMPRIRQFDQVQFFELIRQRYCKALENSLILNTFVVLMLFFMAVRNRMA